jgi:hypothetical protein
MTDDVDCLEALKRRISSEAALALIKKSHRRL